MEHTKGKWRLSNYHYPHNEVVFTVDPSTDNDSRAGLEGRRICRIDGIPEYKANARLIAAAPETKRQRDDLLAACEAMIKALQNTNPDAGDEVGNAEAKMIQAIAKAKEPQK